MTDYVILRATNDSGTVFAVDGEERANSPETAIRKWAARQPPATDSEGVLTSAFFAACPKRSWTVAQVAHEVTTAVKVTAAKP